MKRFDWLLLISVMVIATCGLIYELIAGTLASYLLGDSVTQFSTIIGTYLFAMGIGSWLSGYIRGNLLNWFIKIELLVGIIGGISSSILFLSFEYVSSFRLLLYALITITGILVGLEIPLLMRVLNEMKVEFKELVSRVFTFDYMGALLASIVFPLVLVPMLGLVRTSFFFGLLNVSVALVLIFHLGNTYRGWRFLTVAGISSFIFLFCGFILGDRIMKVAETSAYTDHIIYSKTTKYQRVVLTGSGKETRLFLNGNLQFSSADEYRYHEALVHPAALRSGELKHVLVLGGGDGLAVRELLKYSEIERITVVDLDNELTEMFTSSEMLRNLNNRSFSNKRVKLINEDAFQWIKNCTQQFDCIIIDFPYPSNFSLGKLNTNRFFREVNRILSTSGALVVQSTSPYYAPRSFWCIDTTMKSEGFLTTPYHCYVPSFGEWGFIMGSKQQLSSARSLPAGLKFYNEQGFASMCYFPEDMLRFDLEVNRLNNQALVNYFEDEWSNYIN